MISTLFGWFWLIANLAALAFALASKRNFLTRSLLVGGALLGAAGGLANGLVMSLNGFRMPVESGLDWSGAPEFLSDPEDVGRFYCRAFSDLDPPADPWKSHGVHIDVPSPSAKATGDKPPFKPRLAFLDDRHPYVICGEPTILSKGDIMGGLGGVLIIPGFLLALIGFLWRKILRKQKRPTAP